MPPIASFTCSRCYNQVEAHQPRTVCPLCAGALYVRYDMEALRAIARKPGGAVAQAGSAAAQPQHEAAQPQHEAAQSQHEAAQSQHEAAQSQHEAAQSQHEAAQSQHEAAQSQPQQQQHSMWRYADVLPSVEPVTLGEGWTPMLPSRRYPNVWIKEEATNPTGTFKARGLSMAVSMARHYGLRKLAVPSAGNAAGALAAYAAAAGIEAHIFMPRDVPLANYLECVAYGAHVTLVDGLISDCARMVAERREQEGWFDISTLKEPFRVEGKKTMGYELVEQLGWEYPDAVFYPTGGGVGLIGMWKAFEEMEQLGWVSGGSPLERPLERPLKRPKMIAIQSSGCAPMARAYREGAEASRFFEHAATFASGLRVPKPFGDAIILEIVRSSGGTIVDYPDAEILRSLLDWSKHEGLLLSPEGAAATAAYDDLLAKGFLKPSDRCVLFNTGAGLKYVDTVAEALRLRLPGKLPARMPVGGIITPQ